MIFRDIIKYVDCFEKNKSNSKQCLFQAAKVVENCFIVLKTKNKKTPERFISKEMFPFKNGNSIRGLVLCTASCS